MVDCLALGVRQRAGADGEVFDLVGTEEIGFDTLRGNPAISLGDAPHTLLVTIAHRFDTDIDVVQEGAITVDRRAQLPPAQLGRFAFGPGHDGAQHGEFGIPANDFETRIDELDAIEDRLQLGRLVYDVNRRRHLAAVVQQAGDLEFVAILVAHGEAGQRPVAGEFNRLGQHHRQRRHALAVAAGIGRLLVDRQVDELDERLEQLLQLTDQQAIGQRHRGLGGERLGKALVGAGEDARRATVRVDRVDELQDTDDLVLVILHRYGQERARTVARHFVELARP